MKVAYLASLYPAVSHTFILNEIMALRRLGVEIGTFSIHRAERRDILGIEAESEARSTRAILPVQLQEAAKAIAWCLSRRPRALIRVFWLRTMKRKGVKNKLKWFAYTMEGIILAYWIDRGGYDRLHCHFGNSGSNTAQIAAAIAGVPFSITCHGSELNDPDGFQLKEKVKEASFVACVSKYGRARLMSVSDREDWSKLIIIRCGQKKPKIDEFPDARTALPEILCVGRLSPEKGHYVLLDAFEIMQLKGSRARLILVGDGPLRKELERQAADLPDPEAVCFTGSLDPDAVAERYRTCSIVVLASFSEGVPVVLMEAFSHGRPVVATRVGGIPELVENGRSGYVVSPGDPEELANSMDAILSNPDLARGMGVNGSRKVLEEFNEERSAQSLRALFDNRGF